MDRAKIAEATYRTYEFADRNLKFEILDRIAKVLGVKLGFPSAPTFENRHEFPCTILKNEDAFGYTAQDIDRVLAIAKDRGNAMSFYAELVRD